MGCRACCVCSLVTRIVLLVLLLSLVPTGYLTHEYYLKPWAKDRMQDYADSVTKYYDTMNTTTTLPDLSGASLVDGVACVQCPGVNNVYPVTSSSHPTYSAFQKLLINNGAWVTSMLMTIGVAVGGGGSLVVTLLNAIHGVSNGAASLKPTSSTAQNGCGLFEMVMMVSQAQFITMLGALHSEGTPLFFLEFAKKLAWTNLQIFPSETSYHPQEPEATAAGDRRLVDTWANSNATGIERYAVLVGAEPNHLFYYTCVALAVALGSIVVVYVLLRVMIASCRKQKDVAATLDHRVIWVVLQLLMLVQYVVSMTACFQIYYTLSGPSSSRGSTGDIGLAIVLLALICIGLLLFGVIKVARHKEEILTHGTHDHDETKPFHLRYSVFYLDFTVPNVYFFVAKMVLDVASGAVIGVIQDGALQIAILVALNVFFLVVLMWRQPYLVPTFYYVAVFAGYLRVVLLLLALVQTKDDLFPQDVRDYVGVLIIILNGILLLCILVRQFYVLCVAIFRWASRPQGKPEEDTELGIPLQEMHSGRRRGDTTNNTSSDRTATRSSGTTTKTSSGSSSRRSRGAARPAVDDSTLFASQPYHELKGDENAGKTDRHSMPATSGYYSSSSSSASKPKGGGRRSLYSQRTRQHKKQFAAAKEDELPDWAKV